jgi:hypothetical protein
MTELTRANRIAVSVVGEGYKADFYRTHKKLATILSGESGWEADETMNKSAQREDFRRFAIEHSAEVGIDWQPQDLRAEGNKRIAKYENDELLMADAKNMLEMDMLTLVAKCPYGISFLSLEAETIVAVDKSAKGTDLSKLGVIEGKYERSGNWAWADVEMVLTITKDGQDIYYTTKCQLVSGQLKKPHITQTSFNESIKESLKEVGIVVEESKEEVVEPVTDTNEEVQEVQTEDKPKKTRKSSKKADK